LNQSPPKKKRWNCCCSQKGIPHNHVDLLSTVSVEATGVCIPIGNSKILFAAVNKYSGRTWSDADITELLSFQNKCILAGDFYVKYPSWNSAI
jgi:hypothetical protein